MPTHWSVMISPRDKSYKGRNIQKLSVRDTSTLYPVFSYSRGNVNSSPNNLSPDESSWRTLRPLDDMSPYKPSLTWEEGNGSDVFCDYSPPVRGPVSEHIVRGMHRLKPFDRGHIDRGNIVMALLMPLERRNI
jgi:hypothetical protein